MKGNYFLLMISVASVNIIPLISMDLPVIRILKDPSVQLYKGMEKGPMNSEWFYSGIPPHVEANELHQNRKWKEAAEKYDEVKNQYMKFYTRNGINGGWYEATREEAEYAKNMGRLNLAACLMAQRKPSEHWASFDSLLNIPQQKRISQQMIESGSLEHKIILVRTDIGGIGDIFYFMESANILKKRTGCYVVFSVRDFLKNTLLSVATAYDFGLIGESEQPPKADYETHIISLLGHLLLYPHQTAPEHVVLTAPERAMVEVAQQIDPILAQGKKLVVGCAGHKRQISLIGGKLLPKNPLKHGRYIDSAAFVQLLRKHDDLVLIDCSKDDSTSITVDGDQKNQYIKIASEDQAFDAVIALASLTNDREDICVVGADSGVANVYIRALTPEAQRRVAFIIPNGSQTTGEYDMRVEGEGDQYTHMGSNCRVYKCATPEHQTEVIEKAYQDMMSQRHHVIQ